MKITFETLRKDANLTREQLASLLGVSKETIRKYENSARTPKQKNLSKFKRIFGCTNKDISEAFAYHTLKRIEKHGLDLSYSRKN